MSFARAKRFNYKDPDVQVSPADYYISTSLQKSCTISKSARFPKRNEETLTSSICSRLSCRCSRYSETNEQFSRYSRSNYKNGPSKSSTPFSRTSISNSAYLDKIKERIIHFNQEENKHTPFCKNAKLSAESKLRVKDLVHKYENFPNGLNIWTSEDDDYHSYTSSDNSNRLYKINDTRNNESNKNVQERRIFEEIVIEKMDKIKKNIEEFQENITEIREAVIQKKQNSSLQKYTSSHLSLTQDSSDYIKYIIFNTIEHLRKEFESKQHLIVSETVEKIKNLAKEIYAAKKGSIQDIKRKCDDAASDLYKDIADYIEKNDILELETSHYEVLLPKESEQMDLGAHECFNYENICKVLSDHLQVSQRELEDLKKDKMNVTLKCGSTQEKLLAQTSNIDMLHDEIEELKKSC